MMKPCFGYFKLSCLIMLEYSYHMAVVGPFVNHNAGVAIVKSRVSPLSVSVSDHKRYGSRSRPFMSVAILTCDVVEVYLLSEFTRIFINCEWRHPIFSPYLGINVAR